MNKLIVTMNKIVKNENMIEEPSESPISIVKTNKLGIILKPLDFSRTIFKKQNLRDL